MKTPNLEQEVIDRLRELAEASKDREPSSDVETRLLAAFPDGRPADPAPARGQIRWVPAIAASAVLATVVSVCVLQTRGLPPRASFAPRDAASDTPSPLEGFVAIPGADALPQLESASIVRYELPVAGLPAYGVDIVPDVARQVVDADLLIGQDGYARAIRLVTDGVNSRSTP